MTEDTEYRYYNSSHSFSVGSVWRALSALLGSSSSSSTIFVVSWIRSTIKYYFHNCLTEDTDDYQYCSSHSRHSPWAKYGEQSPPLVLSLTSIFHHKAPSRTSVLKPLARHKNRYEVINTFSLPQLLASSLTFLLCHITVNIVEYASLRPAAVQAAGVAPCNI